MTRLILLSISIIFLLNTSVRKTFKKEIENIRHAFAALLIVVLSYIADITLVFASLYIYSSSDEFRVKIFLYMCALAFVVSNNLTLVLIIKMLPRGNNFYSLKGTPEK